MLLIKDVVKLHVKVVDVQLVLARDIEKACRGCGNEREQVLSNVAQLAVVAVPIDLVRPRSRLALVQT
jgi:hypothetical protein